MKTWEELNKRTSTLQASYDELMQNHRSLQSFRDAREWDKDAQALIGLLQTFKNDWVVYREQQEDALKQVTEQHNSKPIFQRLLSSRSDGATLKKAVEQTDIEIKSVDLVVDSLNELMDKTPANKSEQKDIADGIREYKKELTLLKREINSNLRQTKAIARTKAASWAGSSAGMLGSVAKYKRTSIRMEKERSVVPMENQKAFIEKVLIALERDLNWVMHFKGDDQAAESQAFPTEAVAEYIQRCSYCGRRVSDADDVCKGCGAVI
jgi:hypothetical protein